MFQIELKRLAEVIDKPDTTIREVRRCSVCDSIETSWMIETGAFTVYACRGCLEQAKQMVRERQV